MAPLKGPYTGIDLTPPLPGETAWGGLGLPGRETALLALEMAATPYGGGPEQWRRAGWMDAVSLDFSRPVPLPGAQALKSLRELPQRSQEALAARLPLSVPQRLREAEAAPEAGPGKALLMAARDGAGRVTVAVALYGTGPRIRDWDANFDCVPQDGFHRGFLEQVQSFEREAEALSFPMTAAALGRERIRFGELVKEAGEGGKVRFLLAGYSQGGALIQIWAHRRLKEGLPPGRLLGLGFASPRVRFAGEDGDAARPPLYHILNSDDLTPRVGAESHLGTPLLYRADEALRRACYGGLWEEGDFRGVLAGLGAVGDTVEAHRLFRALAEALEGVPAPEAEAALQELLGGIVRDARAQLLAGYPALSIRYILRRIRRNLKAMDPSGLAAGQPSPSAEALLAAARPLGPRRFAALLLAALSFPHLLVRDAGEGIGAYQYIASWGYEALREVPA